MFQKWHSFSRNLEGHILSNNTLCEAKCLNFQKKGQLPSSSLQCEHFFLPLTLRRRSEDPPADDAVPSPPLPDGGLRGGTWGPGRPRIFDEGGGGPGGMSLNG